MSEDSYSALPLNQQFLAGRNDCRLFAQDETGDRRDSLTRASVYFDSAIMLWGERQYLAAERDRLTIERDELQGALAGLVGIIDKAGLHNLSKGVQLGPTVWYVKASDWLELARSLLPDPPETEDE